MGLCARPVVLLLIKLGRSLDESTPCRVYQVADNATLPGPKMTVSTP